MKKRILIYVMAVITLIASGCSKEDTPKKDLKEFTHETYGEVKLGNYKGLSAEKPIYSVSQEDIDSMIENNQISASCNFCGEKYVFTPGELHKQ